jgi:hypothetical protein
MTRDHARARGASAVPRARRRARAIGGARRAGMPVEDHGPLPMPRPATLAPVEIAMRSLFPLLAIVLLLLVPWIGAWAFAAATFVWWRVVTTIG